MNAMHDLLQFGFQNALVATLGALAVCLVTRCWRNPLLGRTLWLLVLIKLVTPPLWQMPLPLPTATQAQVARIESPTTTATFAQIPATGWIDDGVSRGPAGALAASSTSAFDHAPPQSKETPFAAESFRTISTLQPITVSRPGLETSEVATDSRLSASFAALTDRLPDVSLVSLAGGVWLSGSLLVLLLIAQRTGRFARHLRRCSPASRADTETVESLARRIGLCRAPEVRISAATHPPLVWCLGWRPVLVLPRSLMQQLDGHEQTIVLAHELAHIRRGDHLVRLLEAAVITLFWWHPVVWWARRELQRYEEQCCDADVLQICPDSPETYVNVLVKTVEFLQTRRPAAVAFTSAMAQKHSLVERIERILDDSRPAHWSWASRLAAFALLALLPLSIGIGDDAPPDGERSDQDSPSATQPAGESADDSTTGKTTAATVSEELEEQDPPYKRLGDKRPDGSRRVIAARQRQLVPFDRPYGELGFPEGQYGPHWETVRLATHPAMQDELGLTNQQRRRLTPVYTSLMQKDHEWSTGGSERPNLLKEEYDRTRAILTDEQQQRLEQIIFRRLGFTVFLQPQYAEDIGLTPRQSEQFLKAWMQHVERAVAGWDGNEGRHAYHKLQAETFATLSPEQRQRYAKLLGDPVIERVQVADTAPPKTAPPERSTLMPEFVNEVLYWLPTDTETIIVSRDFQARTIRDDANWKKSLAEPDFFRALTHSLAAAPLFDLPPAVQELFTGKQIEWAILGGRNYEFTSAFGAYRFDGCSVLRFAEPIFAAKDGNPDPLAHPMHSELYRAAQDHWRIAQTDVHVFPVNKESRESWVKPRTGEGLYLAIHDDRTMILATSDVYLMQTLRRIDGESLERALPANLPEWNDIDFSAGTWGIRRVPERSAIGEPTTVSSVVWSSVDSNQPMFFVRYRPRGKSELLEPLQQHWLRSEQPHDPPILEVKENGTDCWIGIRQTTNAADLLPALLFPIQGLPATSF